MTDDPDEDVEAFIDELLVVRDQLRAAAGPAYRVEVDAARAALDRHMAEHDSRPMAACFALLPDVDDDQADALICAAIEAIEELVGTKH